jgi:hypothetical protein
MTRQPTRHINLLPEVELRVPLKLFLARVFDISPEVTEYGRKIGETFVKCPILVVECVACTKLVVTIKRSTGYSSAIVGSHGHLD